jgi:UDP-N-acetylmuramoyl-L-alanyl-D-glutamate--2,6-diaminopimelate ligase
MSEATVIVPSAAAPSLAELALELAPFGARVYGDAGLRVSDLCEDSRRVGPGALFAARRGRAHDGTAFIDAALARGARAVLLERGAPLPARAAGVLEVEELERALPLAAHRVHGHPTRALGTLAITGTNGKTTVSMLVSSGLEAAGMRPARVGTLGFVFDGESTVSSLTTPSADELARFAARVVAGAGTHLVLEASSHALSQHRLDGVALDVAAFTNLTQDHLDFHGSMQRYGGAKRRLFEDFLPPASVINVDDAFGAALARSSQGRVIRVSRAGNADVFARAARFGAQGTQALVVTPSGEREVETRLIGAHNLDNLLLAAGVFEALGVDVGRSLAGASSLAGVPGRLEACSERGDDVTVLVDYAHTPDALARVLDALRSLAAGKLVCVFGCGGDRDPEKRPLMGRAVAERVDRAFVTNDNPRSEDPRAILAAIETGMAGSNVDRAVDPDRETAIFRAVLEAAPDDVVLIAGKGHETRQIIGTEQRAFDDREVARRALAARRRSRGATEQS